MDMEDVKDLLVGILTGLGKCIGMILIVIAIAALLICIVNMIITIQAEYRTGHLPGWGDGYIQGQKDALDGKFVIELQKIPEKEVYKLKEKYKDNKEFSNLVETQDLVETQE